MKKTKVGIFMADSNGGYPVPAVKGGAVQGLVEHLVRENSKKQLFEMHIISIYDEEAEKISRQYPGIHFHFVKPPKLVTWMDSLFFYAVRLVKKKKADSYKSLFSLLYLILADARILKKNRFDRVVLENNIPLAWAIRLSHYRGDYYYHFHNIPRVNAKCRPVFQKATGILCVSRFVARQISRKENPIGPIPKEKIKILYNCIDTGLYQPLAEEEKQAKREEIRKEYGLAAGDKVVVFVGRLSQEKGIDQVLKALSMAGDPQIKLVIAGSYLHHSDTKDDYEQKLYDLAESMKEQVIFTGYIPQERVHEIYQMADLAVLPSMWDEPAGLTMLEAAACGIPVITTQSGGIPEYMKDHAILLKRDEELAMNICREMKQCFAEGIHIPAEDDPVEYIRKNFSIGSYLEKFAGAIGVEGENDAEK